VKRRMAPPNWNCGLVHLRAWTPIKVVSDACFAQSPSGGQTGLCDAAWPTPRRLLRWIAVCRAGLAQLAITRRTSNPVRVFHPRPLERLRPFPKGEILEDLAVAKHESVGKSSPKFVAWGLRASVTPSVCGTRRVAGAEWLSARCRSPSLMLDSPHSHSILPRPIEQLA